MVWDAPDVARPRPDGGWDYSLTWLRLPDHKGDVLNLTVDLPRGWKWDRDGPKAQYQLETDIDGSWVINPPRS